MSITKKSKEQEKKEWTLLSCLTQVNLGVTNHVLQHQNFLTREIEKIVLSCLYPHFNRKELCELMGFTYRTLSNRLVELGHQKDPRSRAAWKKKEKEIVTPEDRFEEWKKLNKSIQE